MHQLCCLQPSFLSSHPVVAPFPFQLYVQARLTAKWARLLRPTIQFFLVAFAVYVGYTRVSDYKHHWSDVLTGLLQGALVAVLNVSLRPDVSVRFLRDLQPASLCVHTFCPHSWGPLGSCGIWQHEQRNQAVDSDLIKNLSLENPRFRSAL